MSRHQRKYSAEFPIQVTARTNNREFFPIPMEDVWEIFGDYLYLSERLFGVKILQFVLMNNHFHMICLDQYLCLSEAMRFLMRETSRAIGFHSGRINRVWGRPFHSSIISNAVYFLHAYRYNYRNPVAAGLCDHPVEYRWSTLPMLLGLTRGIIPVHDDPTLFGDVEGTLAWLNRSYESEQVEALKAGFRRKVFDLPKDPKTNKVHPMSLADSLKFTRRVPEW